MDDLHEVALVACAAAAVLVHLSEKEAAEKEKENDENMRAALNNSVQKRQMLDETPVRGRKRPLPRDDDVADKDERGKSDGDANNERNEISTDPYDEDEDEENDAANAQTKSDKLKKATTSDSAKSFTLDNVLPEELRADYRILCKTGEGRLVSQAHGKVAVETLTPDNPASTACIGTFSTVYKAIDHRHEHYDNESWKHATNYSRFMVEKRPAGSGKFALKQFVAVSRERGSGTAFDFQTKHTSTTDQEDLCDELA